jgi:ribosomal protein S18 acetylase RimI-like enzyme
VAEVKVVRASPGLVWRAFDGSEPVGAVRAFLRPDNRWFVLLDSCRDDSYQPLLAAVAGNTGADLHLMVHETNSEALASFAGLGFTVHRREGWYVIPTDPRSTGLGGIETPDDIVIVSAIDADADQLRELDVALRQDVPGSDGWAWEPTDFYEETFGPSFDPATYLIAVDRDSCEYVGLVRIWVGHGKPRLGLIGVLRPYRRRGLAKVLLGRALHSLHQRGKHEVSGEVDAENAACLSLLLGLGARRRSGSVELIRRVSRR